MKRSMHFLPVIALVALTLAGLSIVHGVNRDQVRTQNGETCFTVKHSTTYYNSFRDAKGKVVFVADKLKAGSQICHTP